MSISIKQWISGIALGGAAVAASAGPVGLDGVIGSDWAGITPVSVTYDAAAPNSNFGSPTSTTAWSPYQIYMRTDGNYLYTAVVTTDLSVSPAGLFTNQYFQLLYGTGTYGSAHSTLGIEVNNDKAFYANTGDFVIDAGGSTGGLIQWATSTDGSEDVIEAAIDMSVFTDNALGVPGYGLPAGQTAVGIRMSLSQSFGYSVAGGSSYGDTGLGFVSLESNVPEPASLALVGLALTGLGFARRRKG